MKKIFIDAKVDIEISIPNSLKKIMSGKVGLLTTIQHLHKLKDIKKDMNNSIIGGQVLGCNTKKAEDISKKVDCFLYIGSGRFHPLAIAIKTGKKVFIYDPYSQSHDFIKQSDIESIIKRNKGKIMKFLNSDNIGILVTTKPGQGQLKKALSLKKKLNDKKCYIFISDMITPESLEAFPFIDCFVNTACPRLNEDSFTKPVINIEDLENFEKLHFSKVF